MFYGNYSQNGNVAFCIIHLKLTAGCHLAKTYFLCGFLCDVLSLMSVNF